MKTRLLALLATALPGLAFAHSTGGVPHSHDAASWGNFFAAVAAGYVAWWIVQTIAERRAQRQTRLVRVKRRP